MSFLRGYRIKDRVMRQDLTLAIFQRCRAPRGGDPAMTRERPPPEPSGVWHYQYSRGVAAQTSLPLQPHHS